MAILQHVSLYDSSYLNDLPHLDMSALRIVDGTMQPHTYILAVRFPTVAVVTWSWSMLLVDTAGYALCWSWACW